MNSIVSEIRRLGLAMAVLASMPGSVIANEAALKGMIVASEGAIVVVRTGDRDIPVVLTRSTKIEAIADEADGRREDRAAADLVRGLTVEVLTEQQDDRLTASRVSFNESDLKTARQSVVAAPGMETRVGTQEKPRSEIRDDQLRSMVDAHVRQP